MADVREAMNAFFIDVQHRAYKQARLAIKDDAEALDLVQEAMMKLAKNYAHEEPNWPKLFQRILQNLIRDWYRRQKVRKIFSWSSVHDSEQDREEEPSVVSYEINRAASPEQHHERTTLRKRLADAVALLPMRQQQAFTLRAWWEHDVAETAFAMGCSEGSVKTHYSRAIARLRELLGEEVI